MTRLRAAIFILESEVSNAALVSQCLDHIATNGYIFDSIVTSWGQILSMLASGDVQVVIYARAEHIDPSWTPRFELAGGTSSSAEEQTTSDRTAPRDGRRRERRPRIVN